MPDNKDVTTTDDLTGMTFGRLTVRADSGRGYYYKWECLCTCGEVTYGTSYNLINGYKKSCGCLRKDGAKGRPNSGNFTRSLTHRAWANLIYNRSYYSAVDNGINNVDPKWVNDYQNFLTDMGKKPSSKFTLARHDLKKPYNKENCYWRPTKKYYRVEKGNQVLSYVHPETNESIKELSARLGIPPGTIYNRLRRGKTLLEAIGE